jgi:hypothetical protein
VSTTSSYSTSDSFANEWALLTFHLQAVFLFDRDQGVDFLVIMLKHLPEVIVVFHMLLH